MDVGVWVDVCEGVRLGGVNVGVGGEQVSVRATVGRWVWVVVNDTEKESVKKEVAVSENSFV